MDAKSPASIISSDKGDMLEGTDTTPREASSSPIELIVDSKACPICHEPIKDRTAVLPCLHEFDYGCIWSWAKQGDDRALAAGGRSCPVCRTNMTKLRRSLREQNGYQNNSKDLPTLSGFTEDLSWPLRPHQYTFEEQLEQTRLSASAMFLTTQLEHSSIEYFSVSVREGKYVCHIKGLISLDIMQRNLLTMSNFYRKLEFRYAIPQSRGASLTDEELINDPTSLRIWEATKAELDGLRDWTRGEGDIMGIASAFTDQGETWRRQLAEVSTRSGVKRGVIRCLSDWQARLEICNHWVELRTELVERGPASDDGRARKSDTNVSGFVTASWQQIRYAEQQIQGALEWLEKRKGEENRRQLHRELTNLLEPVVRMKCKYCDTKEHRNGDCLLPWE